jgi:hypothetical protein
LALEPPRNLKELQKFNGMMVWFLMMLPNYYEIGHPLLKKLSEKDTDPWEAHVMGSGQNIAFERLRSCLKDAPILRLPDFSRTFYLVTDASDLGYGATLAQYHNGIELPVSYYSRAWKITEKHAHSYVKETKAMVQSLEHYKHYFWGSEFFVVTDCWALAHWEGTKDIPSVIEHYLSAIQSYMPKMIHRAGKLIPISDTLSRVFKRENLHGWHFAKDPKNPSPDTASILVTHTLDLDFISLSDKQVEDEEMSKILNFLTKKEYPPQLEEEERRNIAVESECFEMYNGLLVRKGGSMRPRTAIPAGQLRKKILEFFHDDPISGHQGIANTKLRVSERFYWKTLDDDVEVHCRSCQVCQMAKPKVTRKVQLQPVPINAPWSDVHVDYMEMPAAKRTHLKYILLIIDRFTCMVELKATEKANSENSAKYFEKRVLL